MIATRVSNAASLHARWRSLGWHLVWSWAPTMARRFVLFLREIWLKRSFSCGTKFSCANTCWLGSSSAFCRTKPYATCRWTLYILGRYFSTEYTIHLAYKRTIFCSFEIFWHDFGCKGLEINERERSAPALTIWHGLHLWMSNFHQVWSRSCFCPGYWLIRFVFTHHVSQL